MFQFECNAKLLLNFITHPVFIHASRIVRFDNVDETHDVVFRDKACDDGIHGRVLPYTGRVHQHYPALQYIKEVTSGTLSEMDGNWLFFMVILFVCFWSPSWENFVLVDTSPIRWRDAKF